jgi:hypothetical protein
MTKLIIGCLVTHVCLNTMKISSTFLCCLMFSASIICSLSILPFLPEEVLEMLSNFLPNLEYLGIVVCLESAELQVISLFFRPSLSHLILYNVIFDKGQTIDWGGAGGIDIQHQGLHQGN